MGFTDGTLVADGELVAALKVLVAEVRPDVIVTHDPHDYHGDHRALAQAVGIAASFAAPVLHADTLGGVGFAPAYYVDITEVFADKTAAIRLHRSQDPERFVTAAATQNGFRARQCNAPDGSFAEAYRCNPVFPFADIRGLLPPAPPVRPMTDRRRVGT